MFLRIVVIALALATARAIVVHGTSLLPKAGLFSSSSFAQLFSGYFFVGGIIFSTVMAQHKESETLVDDAACAFHELVDSFEFCFDTTGCDDLASSISNNNSGAANGRLGAGATTARATLAHAAAAMAGWAEVLALPPLGRAVAVASSPCAVSGSPLLHQGGALGGSAAGADDGASWSDGGGNSNSGGGILNGAEAATQRVEASLHRMVASARACDVALSAALSPPPTSAAASSTSTRTAAVAAPLQKATHFAASTLKCCDRLRRAMHRIWTIRRTRVLQPAQRYLGVMLVVVLACIFLCEWPSPVLVEVGCTAGASACSLLLHAMIDEIDDPFVQRRGGGGGGGGVGGAAAWLTRLGRAGAWAARALQSARAAGRKSALHAVDALEDEGVHVSVKPIVDAVARIAAR